MSFPVVSSLNSLHFTDTGVSDRFSVTCTYKLLMLRLLQLLELSND